MADFKKEYPLFALLNPSTDQSGQLFPGPVVGMAHFKDTIQINKYLHQPQIRNIFPQNMIFRWTAKPADQSGNYYRLIALKVTSRDGRAPLDGDVITDARQDFDQMGSNPEVAMSMNSEGAKTWQRMTKENIGKSIAIVLDDYVRSFPTVQNEISGGRSSITGLESIEEAKDLANVLKSGKMPAPARIVEEQIVGPSLGKESIRSGMLSFVVAFVMVLAYMLFFYSKKAGLTANIALLANLFFVAWGTVGNCCNAGSAWSSRRETRRSRAPAARSATRPRTACAASRSVSTTAPSWTRCSAPCWTPAAACAPATGSSPTSKRRSRASSATGGRRNDAQPGQAVGVRQARLPLRGLVPPGVLHAGRRDVPLAPGLLLPDEDDRSPGRGAERDPALRLAADRPGVPVLLLHRALLVLGQDPQRAGARDPGGDAGLADADVDGDLLVGGVGLHLRRHPRPDLPAVRHAGLRRASCTPNEPRRAGARRGADACSRRPGWASCRRRSSCTSSAATRSTSCSAARRPCWAASSSRWSSCRSGSGRSRSTCPITWSLRVVRGALLQGKKFDELRRTC